MSVTVTPGILQGKRKVAIVGFCNPHREWAPYADPSFTLVGLNRGYLFQPRAEVWFDMHSPEIRAWQHRRPGDHFKFLHDFAGPVYLHEVDPELPNSIAYPLAEVAADLGEHVFRLFEDGTQKNTADDPYLDSSIAYELALAIHEGAEEIWLLGVDLNTQGEYVWQRSGVSYLLGLAAGRGIKVVIPEPCPLLRGKLYGRGYLQADGERLTSPQLDTRLAALEEERSSLILEYHKLAGALKELDWFQEEIVPGIDHLAVQLARKQTTADRLTLETRLHEAQAAIAESLEIRHQAAQKDRQRLNVNQSEVDGARNLLTRAINSLPPGIGRERLEDRRKQMDQILADLSAKGYQAQGRAKELAYLIHQTADGQDAREAIAQLSEGDVSPRGEVNDPFPERARELVGAA